MSGRAQAASAGLSREERYSIIAQLFEAARSAGRSEAESALRPFLERDLAELRQIGASLDRRLGAQVRAWSDAARVRAAISAEILRRAWRNDVFLTAGAGTAPAPGKRSGSAR